MNLVLSDLDELNAQLAMVRAFWREEIGDQIHCSLESPHPLYEWYSLGVMIQEIQKNIMDISSADKIFNSAWVEKIEKQIDRFTFLLPPINKNVIPSGNKLCASIHIARAVCRRAEQHMIEVVTSGCPSHLYIKRLSDYLFMLSRFVCMSLGIQEDLKN